MTDAELRESLPIDLHPDDWRSSLLHASLLAVMDLQDLCESCEQPPSKRDAVIEMMREAVSEVEEDELMSVVLCEDDPTPLNIARRNGVLRFRSIMDRGSLNRSSWATQENAMAVVQTALEDYQG